MANNKGCDKMNRKKITPIKNLKAVALTGIILTMSYTAIVAAEENEQALNPIVGTWTIIKPLGWTSFHSHRLRRGVDQ